MIFKLNHSMQIIGPSNSGKTFFILNLLKNKSRYFNKPINRVIWCYGETKPDVKNVIFIHGLPDMDILCESDLLILDDLAFDSNKDITNLFTRISHHRKIFTIFVTQNMFASGNRTRSLNSHYFVLFRNPRDKMQISYLAKQMGLNYINNVFNDVTRNTPYAYLLLDLTTTTPDALRVQTGILANENRKYYISKKDFDLKEIYECIVHEEYPLSVSQLKKIENNKQSVENILKGKPYNSKVLSDIVIKEERDNYYII